MFIAGSVLSAAEPVKPFNGSNLDGWEFNGPNQNCWTVGGLKVVDPATMEALPLKGGEKGYLLNMVDMQWQRNNPYKGVDPAKAKEWDKENPRKGVNIYTEAKFGDCTVKVEFLIPSRSNSGVYLMGEYEVQIADAFGKADDKLTNGDHGGICWVAAPLTNASTPPGTWQKMEIEFVAPKFDADGNKTANALFKRVVLNGKLVVNNVEIDKPNGGGISGAAKKEAPTGPLMLQGNHGPAAFRNIEIIVP